MEYQPNHATVRSTRTPLLATAIAVEIDAQGKNINLDKSNFRIRLAGKLFMMANRQKKQFIYRAN